MSNTGNHARKEMALLPADAIVKEFEIEILALVDKFGESGQSGGSAPYVAKIISSTVQKLCMFEPLSPLSYDMEEWSEISELVFQNKRFSAVFMDKDMKPYYLDALIFKERNNSAFTGSIMWTKDDKQMIKSRAYIKDFSTFTGQRFYIPVETEETGEGYWKHWLSEEATEELNKALEIYEFQFVIDETL